MMFLETIGQKKGDAYEALRKRFPSGQIDIRLEGITANLEIKNFVMGLTTAPDAFCRAGVADILKKESLRPPTLAETLAFIVQHGENEALMFDAEKTGPIILFFHQVIAAWGGREFTVSHFAGGISIPNREVYVVSLCRSKVDGQPPVNISLFDTAGIITPPWLPNVLAGVKL